MEPQTSLTLSDASSHSPTARLPIIYSQLELLGDASSPVLGANLRQTVFTELLPSQTFATGAHFGARKQFFLLSRSPPGRSNILPCTCCFCSNLDLFSPNLSRRQTLANLITGPGNYQCKIIVYKARSGTYFKLSYTPPIPGVPVLNLFEINVHVFEWI